MLGTATPRVFAQSEPKLADANAKDGEQSAISGTTFSGRVVDSKGQPVNHADVRISLTRDADLDWTEPERIRDWQVETDSKGRFKLAGVWNAKQSDDLWAFVDVVAYGFARLRSDVPTEPFDDEVKNISEHSNQIAARLSIVSPRHRRRFEAGGGCRGP